MSNGPSAARPRRENRQRARTRKALMSAGQELFAARSMDSVTIDEIVDRAEVAKGSFYNHFNDKAALADAIFELVLGDVEFHIFSINQDVADPPTRIARALCTVVKYAREHPERLQALQNLAARGTGAGSPLNRGLSADIRNGLEQDRLHYADLETGVLVVIGLTNSAVAHAMVSESGAIEALAASMAAATLRALGVPYAEAEKLGLVAANAVLQEGAKA